MNVDRFIGTIGLVSGTMALAFIFAPDTQAGAWLPEVIATEFRSQVIQHFLGGIGAIASGSYLVLFGNS
jgi:hypothetical protein